MKRIVSAVLVCVFLISVSVFSVGAVPAPHFYGDVNCNYDVEITDATYIQRYIAELTEFSDLSKDLADVDADKKVTVFDATMIQRKVADIISGFNQEAFGLYTFVSINNVAADFDSGKAMVGVEVTFSVNASCRDANPLRYVLNIDGTDVAENTEPVFTYTFDEVGEHDVVVVAKNKYDEDNMCKIDYTVVEKSEDDSLMISAVTQNLFDLNEKSKIVITANAYGGTAPYEYSFEMDGYDLKQDYSDDNTFDIGKLPIGNYEVDVNVKDADGNIVSEVYSFSVEDAKIG